MGKKEKKREEIGEKTGLLLNRLRSSSAETDLVFFDFFFSFLAQIIDTPARWAPERGG